MNVNTSNLLDMACSQWVALVKDGDAVSTWQEIETELDAIACKAAMLASYIGSRAGTDGCGHKSHAEAVKACNRRLVKVRKAIGYSYPQHGQINF